MLVSAAPPKLTVLPSIHGRRGDSTTTPLPMTANNNQLMSSGGQATMVGWGGGRWWLKRHKRWKRNDGWHRTSSYSRWQRSVDGAGDNNNKTTINRCPVAEAEDNNSWREATVEQEWQKGQASVVNGRGQLWLSWKDDSRGWILESYLESYLDESCPKPRVFFHF